MAEPAGANRCCNFNEMKMSEIDAIEIEEKDEGKPGLVRWIRNRFFTGVIIALPIGMTIWLITIFVRFVDERVLSLVPPDLNPNILIKQMTGLSIPGTGIIIAIVALFLLGVFVSNFVGTSILKAGERLLARVPLVSNVYNALKQIVNTMAQQKDRAFKEVCLIEYPRKGLWAVGFITSDLNGAPTEHLKEGYVCVFVPTTPNPTSGFLLFTKRTDVKILDMTPEEGAKMIISGGMVSSNEEVEKLESKKGKLKLEQKTD